VVIFRKSDGFAAACAPTTEQSSHSADHTYPDFPLSVLSKTMRKVLTEQGELLLERSPNFGCDALRAAIGHYLARNRGIRVDAEQIIVGAGSEYLYGLIVELLGRNKVYAIESPSYKKIEQVYRAAEITYESLPLTSSGIDSAALANTKADVLHTTPYRSYPSGVTATASKRHEYIRWSEQGDRYIIEDDFESEFSVSTKPTETLFALSKNDHIIYLNTFSKTISPSLRIGYMVLPKNLTKVFRENLGFYSCTVPTFMQYVLTELINNGDFERHINRVRRKKRKELSQKP
jgi:GntR family transcriptional regulator/MocR family aminotransferase